MRLRAPQSAGNPNIAGVTIKPDGDGLYTVDHVIGAHLVESFGFTDADAPPPKLPAAPVAATPNVLRDAVLNALETLGVTIVPGAPDDVLAKAIRETALAQNDNTLLAVKRAESDTLNQFSDELTALKTRAETAEAKVTELEAKIAATPPAQPADQGGAQPDQKTGDKTGA
jgi:hypothetical protein